MRDTTKSMDFGVVFGGGVDFGTLSVDLRLDLGLTSIDDSADSSDIQNRTLSLLVGYRLPFGL